MDSTRQYTPEDNALADLVLRTTHRLQHSRGYDKRSDLHAAVMHEIEVIADNVVYGYCYEQNFLSGHDEVTFTDVKL